MEKGHLGLDSVSKIQYMSSGCRRSASRKCCLRFCHYLEATLLNHHRYLIRDREFGRDGLRPSDVIVSIDVRGRWPVIFLGPNLDINGDHYLHLSRVVEWHPLQRTLEPL